MGLVWPNPIKVSTCVREYKMWLVIRPVTQGLFIITISNFIDIEKLDSIFETRCLLQRGRSVETYHKEGLEKLENLDLRIGLSIKVLTIEQSLQLKNQTNPFSSTMAILVYGYIPHIMGCELADWWNMAKKLFLSSVRAGFKSIVSCVDHNQRC